MKDKPNLLFICSVNRSRSPTAEKIFADDPRFHVASAGTEKNAAVQVDEELLDWADWVVVMEPVAEAGQDRAAPPAADDLDDILHVAVAGLFFLVLHG